MARTADPKVRIAIFGAARLVFQQKGYADARMADIAAVANVAVGTIYLHFRTKEALVVALADDFHRRLLEEAMPMLHHGNFATALATALHTALQIMHEHRDLLAMVYLQLGLAAFSEPSPIEAQVTQALTTALRERMARGEARSFDAEKVALLLIGLVERAALVHALDGEASLPRLEETLVRFVQCALLPDHRDAQPA